MKDLSPRDKELYLINNKLDDYYDLFMTNDKVNLNKKKWLTNI